MTPKWFSGMMTSKNNLHNLELNLKNKTKKKNDRGNLWKCVYTWDTTEKDMDRKEKLDLECAFFDFASRGLRIKNIPI